MAQKCTFVIYQFLYNTNVFFSKLITITIDNLYLAQLNNVTFNNPLGAIALRTLSSAMDQKGTFVIYQFFYHKKVFFSKLITITIAKIYLAQLKNVTFK